MYEYDLMNRMVAKIPDPRFGEPSITFGYNAEGLRTNMTDAGGISSYQYDGNDRLVRKTRIWNSAPLSVSLNYSYDVAGNLTGIQSSDSNGVNVTYGYDDLERLSTVNDAAAGATAYGYDAVGNLQSCTYPNSVSSQYQYDSLNRLTNLASGQLNLPIANYAYTVGPAGNRLTANEQLFASTLNAHPSTIDRAFTYDSNYQLTGETITGANSGTLGYGYDPVGNRLSRNSTLAALPSQNFSFDPDDHLNTDTYDANGNTQIGAGFGQTQPDQYDFENRLVTRSTPGATVSIQYDGDGNRVSKTVTTATNKVTTLYLVDGLNPSGNAQTLEELVSANSQAPSLDCVYTYGQTLISQDRLTGNAWTISFYGYDGHNNVRYLTDVTGVVTDIYDYDAFGNLIASSGVTDNNYLFTGEQYDPDLGLYFLRARYENPNTGRFWNMDSFEGNSSDPRSLHKYLYCNNNPVNELDPTGHDGLEGTLIATGIATMIGGAFLGGLQAALRGENILEGALTGAAVGLALGPLLAGLPLLAAGPAGQMVLLMYGATAGASAALDMAQYPGGRGQALAALDIVGAVAPFALSYSQVEYMDEMEMGYDPNIPVCKQIAQQLVRGLENDTQAVSKPRVLCVLSTKSKGDWIGWSQKLEDWRTMNGPQNEGDADLRPGYAKLKQYFPSFGTDKYQGGCAEANAIARAFVEGLTPEDLEGSEISVYYAEGPKAGLPNPPCNDSCQPLLNIFGIKYVP